MRYCVFDHLRQGCPEMEVELVEMTNSTYKEVINVPIKELKDYSVERNLNALGL